MKKFSNKVSLTGNLGTDVESKMVKSGNFAKVNLGVNEKFTNKAGQEKENIFWFNLIAFGEAAEKLATCKKGDYIAINGKLNQETAEVEGKKKYKINIIVLEIEVLKSK